MNIIFKAQIESLNQAAGNVLNDLLINYKNKPLLLLLSGGSSFKLLNNVSKNNLNDHITISVLDERFSDKEKDTNFFQLTHTSFYQNSIDKKCNFINPLLTAGESITYVTLAFEKSLRKWKKANLEGKVIITQGIGEDGHTAGIMPYPDEPEVFHNLFENTSWAIGYDAKEKNKFPLRITTTITFLKNIVDHSIVYITGENKKNALEKVLAKEGLISEIPARVMKEMKNSEVFTTIKV